MSLNSGLPDAVPLTSSFRDPAGFLFTREGSLYRQINNRGRKDYDLLLSSGLYGHLLTLNLIVPHKEVDLERRFTEDAYKIIQPELIPFISYPYEWPAGMLKDASLLTLRIQKEALDRGLSLKDASAYNCQFIGCRPVFIDTSSFEAYAEDTPWAAYGQFCRHFLLPLALMSYTDSRVEGLWRAMIDGFPLDLGASLLPLRSFLRPGLLVHLHLHARFQRIKDKPAAGKKRMSKYSLYALLDNLTTTVEKLEARKQATVWSDYYSATNYTDKSLAHKEALVSRALDEVRPETVWDVGANTGHFARLSSRKKIHTVAFDFDGACVQRMYEIGKKDNDRFLLPLTGDITNPSPALGWAHEERLSLASRAPADLVLCLALVHHLAIANNTPLPAIASYFSRLGRHLLIEFVPKEDSQVQRLLASRSDIFDSYNREHFEKHFSTFFDTIWSVPVEGSERTLYLLKSRTKKLP